MIIYLALVTKQRDEYFIVYYSDPEESYGRTTVRCPAALRRSDRPSAQIHTEDEKAALPVVQWD